MPQSSITAWLKRPAVQNDVCKDTNAEKRDGSNTTSTVKLIAQSSRSAISTPESAKISDQGDALPTHSTRAPNLLVKPLPLNVTLVPCTEQYLAPFQRLTSLLLPIPYSKGFYAETLENPVIASVTRVALWHETEAVAVQRPTLGSALQQPVSRVVGGIRCRLLPTSPPTLYISTIGVLAPFREHGLATHLLNTAVQTAVRQFGVKEVTAHVWVANDEALAWYKRRGFKVIGREESYYQRLKPQTAAWVISWRFNVTDYLQLELT